MSVDHAFGLAEPFFPHPSTSWLAMFISLLVYLGCAPSETQIKAKQAEAVAAYQAALIKCTNDSNTIDESRACEERVDAQWNIVVTVSPVDGGAR